MIADNSGDIKNEHGDIVKKVELYALSNESFRFDVYSDMLSDTYSYAVIVDAAGKASIWFPVGSQLVICRDADTLGQLKSEVRVLTASPASQKINAPTITDFAVIGFDFVSVTWDGDRVLDPILFMFGEDEIITPPVINGNGDIVKKVELDALPGEIFDLEVYSDALLDTYLYSVTADAITGKAEFWLPIGHQLVICRDADTLDQLKNEVRILTAAPTSQKMNAPSITDFTVVGVNSVSVTWEGDRVLDPIVFMFSDDTAIPTNPPNPPAPSGSSGGSGFGSAVVVPNNGTNNTPAASNIYIPSQLRIECVDENGNKLFVQSVTAVVGITENIKAPLIQNYELEKGEASDQTVTIKENDNIVTFRYAEYVSDEPNYKYDNSWIMYSIIAFICGFCIMFAIHLHKGKE